LRGARKIGQGERPKARDLLLTPAISPVSPIASPIFAGRR
jgi:hypothetical protein